MYKLLKGTLILLVVLCGVISMEAQSVKSPPSGRFVEIFPYPFRSMAYVSPRYDRLNYGDHTFFDSYYIRSIVTLHGKYHFRLDLPLINTNNTPDKSRVFGLGDISLQYTQIVAKWGQTFFGYHAKAVLPTATATELGAGKFQLYPGIGGIYFFNNNKGSVLLGAEYRFSFAGDSHRENIQEIAFNPNIDYWGKNFYVGFYPTWLYNIETSKFDIPLDFEVGYNLTPKLVFSVEYIYPLLSYSTYKNEFSFKLRYNIHIKRGKQSSF